MLTKVEQLHQRIINETNYYVEHESTVRLTGKHFGVSKTNVHIDLTKRLKKLDKDLYFKVKKIMNKNKKERHLRGGLATKRKYYLLQNSK